jgi:hypothetical protein
MIFPETRDEAVQRLGNLKRQFNGKSCSRTSFYTGAAVPAVRRLAHNCFAVFPVKKITRADFFAASLSSSGTAIT